MILISRHFLEEPIRSEDVGTQVCVCVCTPISMSQADVLHNSNIQMISLCCVYLQDKYHLLSDSLDKQVLCNRNKWASLRPSVHLFLSAAQPPASSFDATGCERLDRAEVRGSCECQADDLVVRRPRNRHSSHSQAVTKASWCSGETQCWRQRQPTNRGRSSVVCRFVRSSLQSTFNLKSLNRQEKLLGEIYFNSSTTTE